MKWVVLFLLFFISNCYAGFESTLETSEKRKEEELTKTKEYIDSVIGKTAWYNSDKCISDKIYKDKNYILGGNPYISSVDYKKLIRFDDSDNKKYDDSTYKTDGEYVSIKFIDAEIIKDDYILFTVNMDEKEKGYLKIAPYFLSIFKDNYGINCLKKEKPNKEDVSSSVNYYYDPNKWNLGKCEKDRFNGQKLCEISNGNLMVVVLNGRKLVWILEADYPEKQSAIKVDGNNTIFGVEGSFSNNLIIINQLLKGKKAYIRHVEWPYSYNVDQEIDLSGFKEAYENMLKEYAKLK